MLPPRVDILLIAPVSIDTAPIERLLQPFNDPIYSFVRAFSIEDATTSLAACTPHLVLAHADIGEADILFCIKHLTSNHEIPLIVLTPDESVLDDHACLEAGAHGFVILEKTSPVRFERLLRFIISNANAQRRLKQMLETRDHFLSLLAHDLRGPLGILYSGFKHYHQHFQQLDPVRIERFLFNGKNQTQDILALTQSILSWASAHDDHLITHPKSINLQESTLGNLKTYQQALSEKNLQVSIEIDPQIQITADPDMWDTIVRNFFYNAVKFSPPSHHIRLIASILPNTDTVCFTIADQGIGMTSSQIKQLLESSGPVETRRGTENERGHGLGIQICTQYIRLLKGSLNIHSEKDIGTQIHIHIPLAPNLVPCS